MPKMKQQEEFTEMERFEVVTEYLSFPPRSTKRKGVLKRYGLESWTVHAWIQYFRRSKLIAFKTHTVGSVIGFMNELVKIDRDAITALLETRVTCNKKMAKHPTVQVATRADGTFEVGLLGILNGLFGVNQDNYGHITAVTVQDDNGGVRYVQRFERT